MNVMEGDGRMQVRTVTDDEVAFFHDNGWAYLPGFVDTHTASHLLDRAEEVLRIQGKKGDFGDFADRCFRAFPGEDRASAFTREVLLSPVMGGNMTRLLDLTRVRMLTDAYLLKTPADAGAHDDTLFHQDFPGNPVDRSNFLCVWIALHDMTAEAGTMRFYNRSHTKGVFGQVFADGLDLRKRCAYLRDADLSAPLNMHAGDATIHHCLTVHGAPPNRSRRPRWAYNACFMDADSRYTASPGNFPAGVAVAPFGLLDHPAFPIVPTA
jgi:hypothetical protein